MSGCEMTKVDLHKKVEMLRIGIIRVRVKELVGVYGSVRRAGRALNIDAAYLHRLMTGEKVNPSKVVLKKLGLEP